MQGEDKEKRLRGYIRIASTPGVVTPNMVMPTRRAVFFALSFSPCFLVANDFAMAAIAAPALLNMSLRT